MGETTAATMREVSLAYFRCLDTEDWVTMRTLWTPEATLRAVGARPRSDRDGVIEYFSKLFDPWTAHRDHPERMIVSEADRTLVAEVTFTGTTADGRDVRFEAVDVFDFVDGRINRFSNWYDIDYARRSLSVAG